MRALFFPIAYPEETNLWSSGSGRCYRDRWCEEWQNKRISGIWVIEKSLQPLRNGKKFPKFGKLSKIKKNFEILEIL